jgi:uncharacterized protein YdbL (DUF1318 family)
MKIILTTIFLALSFFGLSQTTLTMKEARAKGLVKELDKTHTAALNNDNTLAAFPTNRKEEFLTAYKLMFYDLANHLDKNGFKFGKETACYNRIYFNSNGSINYYLYSIKPDEIEPANEAKFKALLTEFVKTYRLKINASTNYCQSGPVKFTDKK